MSPPLLNVGEGKENHTKVTLLASSTSTGSLAHKFSGFKEHNYMGFSDCSSVDSCHSSRVINVYEEGRTTLNLEATELSLGLPGSSQSPERPSDLCLGNSSQLDEKPLFPLHPSSDGLYLSPQKTVVSSNKRGFSDAMDGFSEGKYLANSAVKAMPSPRSISNLGSKTGSVVENLATHPVKANGVALQKIVEERPCAINETHSSHSGSANNNSNAPATKAQVVGWPPIRAFRKNSLVTSSKNTDEVDGKATPGALFIKVSMDGAPYLRKVDLRLYSAYRELSSALEKMFSCFTIGQCGSNGALGREILSESKLKDLLRSEYVLTYEDKDGDWMLVGDVPWEMFMDTCKRLRIMKSSDAIGLAPRAVEKCRNRN